MDRFRATRLEAASTPATILVADDDHGVRRYVQLVLNAAGFRVIAAATGSDAVALAATQPAGIHLLIADVSMPGLSGPEVASRLRAARPDLPVLYLTGGDTAAAVVADERAACLDKPFTPQALLAHVRAGLAES